MIELVVAADLDGGIGKNGGLPWRLPGDMAHFKELTTAAPPGRVNAVIMGRKTWESLPPRFRPLPGRANVVVTGNAAFPLPDGVARAGSLEEAVAWARGRGEVDRLFVIGGGELYRAALRSKGRLRVHLTRVHARFDCDTTLPPLSDGFQVVRAGERRRDDGLEYEIQVLEREE